MISKVAEQMIKKWIPLTTGLFLLILGGNSCQPSKDAVRNSFIKKCKTALPGTMTREMEDQYCNCAAEKLLKQFSLKEIIEMEQKKKTSEIENVQKMRKAIRCPFL
jgi:hypothetical protein